MILITIEIFGSEIILLLLQCELHRSDSENHFNEKKLNHREQKAMIYNTFSPDKWIDYLQGKIIIQTQEPITKRVWWTKNKAHVFQKSNSEKRTKPAAWKKSY